MEEIKRCSNFKEVLVNGDDQVLVRELLIQYVPIKVQDAIVSLFNLEFEKRRVIREWKEEEQ